MPIYKGNTKIVKLYKGSTQIVKRYKGTDLIYSASRLPAEFQEVEYIESSGTQYIDTGLATNSYDKIEFDFEISSFIDTDTTHYDMFIGARTGSNYNVIRSVGQYIAFYYSSSHITTVMHSLKTRYNTIAEYGNDLQKITVNGTEYSASGNRASIPLNTWIFIINRDGNGYRPSAIKLYLCKIYDNGTLVRNFVPCYRKADNVAGLYDLVNGVFYTNAGTGTFIVGGNV